MDFKGIFRIGWISFSRRNLFSSICVSEYVSFPLLVLDGIDFTTGNMFVVFPVCLSKWKVELLLFGGVLLSCLGGVVLERPSLPKHNLP